MKIRKNGSLVLLFACFIIFQACKKPLPEIKWNYTDIDIIGSPFSKAENINIDVYIDATTSMQGFAVSNSSVYSQFLDQLEASALSAWKKADAKYYKFGEKIKPIDRSEFLSAKNNLQFYHEKGIFLKTYIDSVITRTDPERLSVLITDLFQDEGDVNTMVDRFKEICFAKGVMVGIIAVESPFKGRVYDVPGYPGGYNLSSEQRPFYAITFGNPSNMELLFESLKTKPFVKEEQFLIFSPYVVKSYRVSLTKTRDSKSITNKKASQLPNSFDFGMFKDGKEAKFDFAIDIGRNTRCADFSADNIQFVVYKKSITDPKNSDPDSIVITDKISFQNLQRTGDKLTATVILQNDDPIGNYSYVVYLSPNPLNGLVVPPWIANLSTDEPIPDMPSAAKTYNLEKFTSRLLVAHSSVTSVYLGKFYINIFKR